MSPLPNFGNKPLAAPEKSSVPTPPAVPPVSQAEPQPVVAPQPPAPQTTVLVSELDSYIEQRQRSEPQSLESIGLRSEPVEQPGVHPLSLPDHFEKLSYDCTRGDTCTLHTKETTEIEGMVGVRRVKITNPGPYVFRWVFKHKRALDQAIDVRGWLFANRTKFHQAEKSLFTANGAVERGDTVLMFMPVERALRFRKAPSERSIERLRGRMTPSPEDPKKILMAAQGDKSGHIYMPDLSQESAEGTVSEAPGITVSP